MKQITFSKLRLFKNQLTCHYGRINEHKSFNNCGQALVENVLLIPIVTIVIVMLFWFGCIVLTKQQLVMAARYGTDLILYTNLTKDQIKAEIQDYLCGKDVQGRKLDASKLVLTNDNIVINKCAKVNSFNAVQRGMDLTTSYVQIYYQFETPALFSAWNSYIGGSNIIKKLRIGARSEVLAGTGCQGDN